MHAVTPDCSIECLAPALSRSTLGALLLGIDGSPVTVGHVIELYKQGRLQDIYNISSGRAGEIKRCLVAAGLIELGDDPLSRWPRIRDN